MSITIPHKGKAVRLIDLLGKHPKLPDLDNFNERTFYIGTTKSKVGKRKIKVYRESSKSKMLKDFDKQIVMNDFPKAVSGTFTKRDLEIARENFEKKKVEK